METKRPSLDRLVKSYLMCCQAEGKSPKTIEWYWANLKRLCGFLRCRGYSLQVEDVGVAEIREFIYYLQHEAVRWANSRRIEDSSNLSPYSVQGYVRSIKAFWSWLTLEGYATQNVMYRLRLPKVPKKVVATFTPEQIDNLLRMANVKTARGFRDRLIILILLDTGLAACCWKRAAILPGAASPALFMPAEPHIRNAPTCTRPEWNTCCTSIKNELYYDFISNYLIK